MQHLLTFQMSKRDKFYLFAICLRTNIITEILHRLYALGAIEWKDLSGKKNQNKKKITYPEKHSQQKGSDDPAIT